MRRDDSAYMDVIWNKLDRYKQAVIGKKSMEELKSLKEELQKELAEMADYNETEVAEYFQIQCRNIEARHSLIGHPITN
jgi:hypothetical protein